MMSVGRFPPQFKPLCLRCRFTLALHVPLPDAAAREDILIAHLERHCRLHTLGDEAVDHGFTAGASVGHQLLACVFAWHGIGLLLCSGVVHTPLMYCQLLAVAEVFCHKPLSIKSGFHAE